MSGIRVSNPIRFNVEKFDGRINFGLWQVQVRDVLIQSGLHKALKGRLTVDVSGSTSSTSDTGGMTITSRSDMSDADWEDLDLRAASAIRLCLAKNVLANIHGISTAKELWEKLEELYQTKGVSNRVYLKEQFHTFRMKEGASISDNLSVLNGIVSKLEAIGVKIDDEDQALRLIWSLPSFYEHMKPLLIHGKDKIILSEVTGKLFAEERRLRGGSNVPHEDSAMVASGSRKKHSMKKQVVCWKCGQSGHIRTNCSKSGASSAKSSKSVNGDIGNEANVVYLSDDVV